MATIFLGPIRTVTQIAEACLERGIFILRSVSF